MKMNNLTFLDDQIKEVERNLKMERKMMRSFSLVIIAVTSLASVEIYEFYRDHSNWFSLFNAGLLIGMLYISWLTRRTDALFDLRNNRRLLRKLYEFKGELSIAEARKQGPFPNNLSMLTPKK